MIAARIHDLSAKWFSDLLFLLSDAAGLCESSAASVVFFCAVTHKVEGLTNDKIWQHFGLRTGGGKKKSRSGGWSFSFSRPSRYSWTTLTA